MKKNQHHEVSPNQNKITIYINPIHVSSSRKKENHGKFLCIKTPSSKISNVKTPELLKTKDLLPLIF